jgi:hypothetical protein
MVRCRGAYVGKGCDAQKILAFRKWLNVFLKNVYVWYITSGRGVTRAGRVGGGATGPGPVAASPQSSGPPLQAGLSKSLACSGHSLALLATSYGPLITQARLCVAP